MFTAGGTAHKWLKKQSGFKETFWKQKMLHKWIILVDVKQLCDQEILHNAYDSAFQNHVCVYSWAKENAPGNIFAQAK